MHIWSGFWVYLFPVQQLVSQLLQLALRCRRQQANIQTSRFVSCDLIHFRPSLPRRQISTKFEQCWAPLNLLHKVKQCVHNCHIMWTHNWLYWLPTEVLRHERACGWPNEDESLTHNNTLCCDLPKSIKPQQQQSVFFDLIKQRFEVNRVLFVV